jgi:hypothetical protein
MGGVRPWCAPALSHRAKPQSMASSVPERKAVDAVNESLFIGELQVIPLMTRADFIGNIFSVSKYFRGAFTNHRNSTEELSFSDTHGHAEGADGVGSEERGG